MAHDAPACAAGHGPPEPSREEVLPARLFEMVQDEVGALPGVERVEVQTVWHRPWTPERMSEEARAKLRLPLERLLPLREARARERGVAG